MKAVTAVLLFLNAFKPIISASSRTHAEIDRIYDKLADEQAPVTVVNNRNNRNNCKSNNHLINTDITTAVRVSVSPASPFHKLDDVLLTQVISFIEEPFAFSLTCKLFWYVYSAVSRHRVFNHKLIVPEEFNLQACTESSITIPALTKAFGNRDQIMDLEFLARNLELALYSPAIRAVFDIHLWGSVRSTSFFRGLIESLLMNSHDKFLAQGSPAIDSYRRTLIYVLASLPKTANVIKDFFIKYPIHLLQPETEICFQKLSSSISERIALLESDFIVKKVLKLFSYDERILRDLVKIYFQTANHIALNGLLSSRIPDEFKSSGKSYVGCVAVDELVYFAEKYLNVLDPTMDQIISRVEKKRPGYFSPFLACLLERFVSLPLEPPKIFHVAVLKSLWNVLAEFKDFDFSYEKNDSEFMSALIENDQRYADNLLDRFPKLAAHKAFLLHSKYQERHLGTFTNLRSARIELKRTIKFPEITRAHILYIQDFQIHLFQSLLADSAQRISTYFSKHLEGTERKRYTEHPSFTIALTTLDIYYETLLQKKLEIPELDPEIILRDMLHELGLLTRNNGEYLELAHSLPSFAKALLANGHEEDTLAIPEAALTQNFNEFELLSRTIALNRVIHDGVFVNYRLVLKWFEDFGTRLAGRIIPIHELKTLLKGAAFQTIRTTEDKRHHFDTESNYNRDKPFSMTYRYALIIIVTQCKGIQAATLKRLKNLFPGADFDQSTQFNNILKNACNYYREHSAFFSQFNYMATNSRSERFLIDFIRHFIAIKHLKGVAIEIIISEFFAFISLDPVNETLLRDHFIYFTILAAFNGQ